MAAIKPNRGSRTYRLSADNLSGRGFRVSSVPGISAISACGRDEVKERRGGGLGGPPHISFGNAMRLYCAAGKRDGIHAKLARSGDRLNLVSPPGISTMRAGVFLPLSFCIWG